MMRKHYWLFRENILHGKCLANFKKNATDIIKYVYSVFVRFYISNKSASYHVECRQLKNKPRVLVVGVVLGSKKNTAAHLINEFRRSNCFSVTQHWAIIGRNGLPQSFQDVISLHIDGFVPKFSVINKLLSDSDWRKFDIIIISDDDLIIPKGFVDSYLSLQLKLDFSLAQPARTRNSHTDHQFVLQNKSVLARRTRFVEIGPLFSIHKELARSILPFDETSPMGWGYDNIWPVVVDGLGMKMGIIDRIAVDHSLRPQGKMYSRKQAHTAETEILSNYSHLKDDEPFQVYETYYE